MPDQATAISKSEYLSRTWPQATEAMKRTYLGAITWTALDGHAGNLVGYWLWALTNFETRVHDLYPDEQYPRTALDLAAAHEVYYHWARRTKFKRPMAALAKCLTNLAAERPERLAEARQHLVHQPQTAARKPNTGPTPIGDVVRELFIGDP